MRVGVWDGGSVAAWERGRKQPSPAKIPRLADALGVKPLDLFEVTGHPPLEVLRRAAGLTLIELAGLSGLPYSRCERLEKGTIEPADEDERRLAGALGVRVKDVHAAVLAARHAAAAMRKPTASAGP